MDNNIYSTPNSQLSETPSIGQYGSIERGINGDYEVSVGAVLKEAWAKTKGAKWTLHVAVTLYAVIYLLVAVALSFLFNGNFSPTPPQPAPDAIVSTLLKTQLSSVLMMAIVAPIGVGLFMLGVRRSVAAPISATMILGHYNRFAALAITQVLLYIATIIGFLLLIIPGIYLSIALCLALPLALDKKMGPMEALNTSRKAIGKHWFSVFGLFLTITLLNAATILTLGIGLIWTIPMSIIAVGILYRNIFGCEIETISE
ncbi:MAG: hypothetical protein QM709_01475 [Spongiibacteraceae bacterium]